MSDAADRDCANGARSEAHLCGCARRWTSPRAAALPLRRRDMLRAAAAAVAMAAAGCGAVVSPAHREAAQRIAEESPSVDLDSHPGMLGRSSPLGLAAQAERMARGPPPGVAVLRGRRRTPDRHAGRRRALRHSRAPARRAGDAHAIGAALLARGRSREDVAKVLGGNFVRLFQQAAAT